MATLEHHLEVMSELVSRDKNRAAVIMWSLANEPDTRDADSESYFKNVAEWTRSLDPTRPVMFVTDSHPGQDYAVSDKPQSRKQLVLVQGIILLCIIHVHVHVQYCTCTMSCM